MKIPGKLRRIILIFILCAVSLLISYLFSDSTEPPRLEQQERPAQAPDRLNFAPPEQGEGLAKASTPKETIESPQAPTSSARLLLQSQNGDELPAELKVILETDDNVLSSAVATKSNDSKQLILDSFPANLRCLTILHPDYDMHSTLALDATRNDGFAGVVSCYRAPKIEISGLTELSLGDPSGLEQEVELRIAQPKHWPKERFQQRSQRFSLIRETGAWPDLNFSPQIELHLWTSSKIQPGIDNDKITISAPTSGSTQLWISDKRGGRNLEDQRIDLRSGETTYIDLRSLNLASLIASYEIPSAFKTDSTFMALSQRDESGAWKQIRWLNRGIPGELFSVGLPAVETLVSLKYNVSPEIDLLPTEQVLTLKPGMNHFKNIFGSPREITVHAETGKTSFGHQAGLIYEIRRDAQVLYRDGVFIHEGQRRLCVWPSDTVHFIYVTRLEGFSSDDFVTEEATLGPSQCDVFFNPQRGSALRLSGVDWGKYRQNLVLQNGRILKLVDSPTGTTIDERLFSLPEGPLKLILLPHHLLTSRDQPGLEIQLFSRPLKPGEISDQRISATSLKLQRLRFVGDQKSYSIAVIDSYGQPHLETHCTIFNEFVVELPKALPLTLIHLPSGKRRPVELKDLPDGEVQTIKLP
jgi:hypothetical protein